MDDTTKYWVRILLDTKKNELTYEGGEQVQKIGVVVHGDRLELD